MLTPVIRIMTERLKETGIFKVVHGLADMITETRTDNPALSKRYPAIYTQAETLRFISGFDFGAGFCYFICTNQSQTEIDSKRGCDTFKETEYNLTFYAMVKRGDTENIRAILEKCLTINNEKWIRITTGSTSVRAMITDIETEKDNVLPEIFENVDFKAPLDMLYFAVEVPVTVQYYTKCIMINPC
jgi:hypothetical protein